MRGGWGGVGWGGVGWGGGWGPHRVVGLLVIIDLLLCDSGFRVWGLGVRISGL